MNRRVDIWEDIKQYQETLSDASGKVDYSIGESIYMLPSNMNLNIKSRTVAHNKKILVSDSGFSLGRNDTVNALVPSHRALIVHPPYQMVALVLSLASAFGI